MKIFRNWYLPSIFLNFSSAGSVVAIFLKVVERFIILGSIFLKREGQVRSGGSFISCWPFFLDHR